jgi:hypothetical protein
MSASTATAFSRIGKLIRLLESDKPGEAIGAVHAIRRTLAGAGLDLHDLAHVIETVDEIKIMPSDETTDWRRLAARLLHEHGGELSGKEVDFLSTMSRWRGTPSPRQRKWLDDIAQRFARAAA